MLDNIIVFFKNFSKPIIITLILILVGVVIMVLLHFFTKQAARKAANKRATSTALLLRKIFNYLFVLVLILVILRIWGFDISILLWTLAIVAIIIGLAAHKLINDILSGIVIVFGNYYEVDDVVQINGFKGKVLNIKIRSTHLLNSRGELKIITHGSVNELINYSRHYSLAELKLIVNFTAPIEQIIIALQEKLSNLVEFFPQIIEGPNVMGITDFKKEGIEISIVAKTLSEQHYEVERALKKIVSELFKEKGFVLAKDEVVITSER